MILHDEMLDNVAAYALGILPAGEAAAVADHLQTCGQCREEYRLLRPAVTAIACSSLATDSTMPAVVNPLLKAHLMKQVRAGAAPQRGSPAWPAYLGAAACLLFALITLTENVALKNQLNQDRTRRTEQNQAIAALVASDSRRYHFGKGEVLTHGRRLYLAMRNLPALPKGKVYQAWTLAKGAKTVAPSITFEPDTNGVAVIALPVIATSVAAVAVSVEPSGGSLQPTSKPIAMVKLGS